MRTIQTEFGLRYIFEVNQSMRERCLDFAHSIISSENQYNRLLNGQAARIQRTYMGKIAELVFLEWLNYKGIDVDTKGMFEIYEGQENVDSFDFIINGLSIDVKAAYRSNHKNLLINKEQFERLHKDIYVGIKLNAEDTDTTHKTCDLNSVNEGTIYGYAEYEFLKAKARYGYYTESYAYAYPLEKLLNIDKLLRRVK